MREILWALEIDRQQIGAKAAVEIGAQGQKVAAAGELLDMSDVRKKIGDGGAAPGELVGREDEAGEEIDADESVGAGGQGAGFGRRRDGARGNFAPGSSERQLECDATTGPFANSIRVQKARSLRWETSWMI